MKYTIIISLLFLNFSNAQTLEKDSKDISVSPFIDGTILVPKTAEKIPLAVIIAGSGPTDRNGNQQMMENNSLRYLAEGLYKNNIASFRYDKRIVKQMKDRNINEENIRFDDFIKDAKDVLAYFKKANVFSKIYIIGHSQGSLVGMVALEDGADGFVSIAGPGRSIDQVIVEQLSKQAPQLTKNAKMAFAELKANGNTTSYDKGLASIFRPALQPFIYSWMKYNPKAALSKLDIPILIINGDNDIQIAISEAEELQKAKPGADYLIIPQMNHILKKVGSDGLENQKTYNDPKLPVMPALIRAISDFIKE